MTNIFTYSALRAALAAGALTIAIAAPAQAAAVYTYDFKMSGGAYSSLAWVSSHLFVEVTENSSTAANDVLFKFTNEIPILNPAMPPSVAYLYFDTGTGPYSGLFTGMSVTETSGGVNFVPRTPPTSSPFFDAVAPFTPDYKFGLSSTFPLDNPINGINPGEYAVLSTTLNSGMTFADLISAMNVGTNANAATAAAGLRVGVFTYYNAGTQRDDAAHVTNSLVSVASVPLPAAWPMMMAGLGLMGFVARRRKA